MKFWLLTLIVFIGGCKSTLSYLTTNLSDTHVGACDEKLTGTWLIKFTGQKPVALYVKANVTGDCEVVDFKIVSILTENTGIVKEETKLSVTFTTINNRKFLSINVVNSDGSPRLIDVLNGTMSPINYLIRYEWGNNNNLYAFLLNNKGFRLAIRTGNIKGKIINDIEALQYTHKERSVYAIDVKDNDTLDYISKHLVTKPLPLLRLSNKTDIPLYAWPIF